MRHAFLLVPLVIALAGQAGAQHTVLFALDSDEFTLDLGSGLLGVGTCGEDEVDSVTPAFGAYSARPFLTRAAQWSYIGDADLDGRFVNDAELAPGGDVDCVFVRRGTTGPVGPRDVFISKESTNGMAAGFADGDVFRYAGPSGALEVFVSEAQLIVATNGSANIDTNAMCQSDAGDLFFSISTGTAGFDDGDLVYIPAAAITYDAWDNVVAIAPGSAVRLAAEAELELLIAASGFKTSTGGSASTTFDLSGLEIDPAGGTWLPQSSMILVPNLLFAWNGSSNDGAIISTANGGEIAVINGVQMGSEVATQGLQIGLLPDATGVNGIEGLAVIPAQPPRLVTENYPVDLHTGTGTGASWLRVEVAGATPGGFVTAYLAVGPQGPGGVVGSVPLLGGEFFTGVAFFPVGPILIDPLGYGEFHFTLEPSPSVPGANVVWQVIDPGSLTVSTGAAVQFL